MAATLTDLDLNPARPSHVPPHAEWYFDSQEWLAAERDEHGELHGLLRTYRVDGTPWLEYEYRHGKRHGRFRRFYPSGAVAQEGRYLDELPDGLLVVSSDGSNTDSIRECCIPNAARVIYRRRRCSTSPISIERSARCCCSPPTQNAKARGKTTSGATNGVSRPLVEPSSALRAKHVFGPHEAAEVFGRDEP